jgi:hypothetical protein
MTVGLRSHYVASFHAAPLMIDNGRGLIVNTGHYGAVSYYHGAAYGAQKAGSDEMAADMARNCGRTTSPRSRSGRSLAPTSASPTSTTADPAPSATRWADPRAAPQPLVTSTHGRDVTGGERRYRGAPQTQRVRGSRALRRNWTVSGLASTTRRYRLPFQPRLNRSGCLRITCPARPEAALDRSSFGEQLTQSAAL